MILYETKNSSQFKTLKIQGSRMVVSNNLTDFWGRFPFRCGVLVVFPHTGK